MCSLYRCFELGKRLSCAVHMVVSLVKESSVGTAFGVFASLVTRHFLCEHTLLCLNKTTTFPLVALLARDCWHPLKAGT